MLQQWEKIYYVAQHHLHFSMQWSPYKSTAWLIVIIEEINCWNAANRMPAVDYETHNHKRLPDAQTMWNAQSIDDSSLGSCEIQEAHRPFCGFVLSHTRARANFCVCLNCNVTNTIGRVDSQLRKWISFFLLLRPLFNIFYDFNGHYIDKPVETCVDVL